jgi:hypothetical protein
MAKNRIRTIADYFDARRELICTDPASEVARLELLIGESQAEVVDDFIENSCWRAGLPDFVGGKGIPAERRDALRVAMCRKDAP